jgi:hypothetical protein
VSFQMSQERVRVCKTKKFGFLQNACKSHPHRPVRGPVQVTRTIECFAIGRMFSGLNKILKKGAEASPTSDGEASRLGDPYDLHEHPNRSHAT